MTADEIKQYQAMRIELRETERQICRSEDPEPFFRRREEILEQMLKIEDYIAECDDPLVNLMMRLRYIQGLSWDEVADEIGRNNTADGCRKIVKRYIES